MSPIAPQSLTTYPCEAPLIAQALLQEVGAGAAGDAVDRVVDAHDGTGLRFHDRRLERVQVGVDQVVLADRGVEGMAQRLGTAVHGEVLGRGDGLQVARIAALHACDEGYGQPAGQVRVFAVGLLTAPPAGVPEDVDVRRPVVEIGDAAGSGARRHLGHGRLAHRLVELRTGFGGDDVGHLVHQHRIERGAEPDRFGKHRGAPLSDAVQRLVPPVVDGHAETRNRGGAVLHLQHLLFQRHPGHEIRRPLLGRQAGIEVGRTGALGERRSRQRREDDREQGSSHLSISWLSNENAWSVSAYAAGGKEGFTSATPARPAAFRHVLRSVLR